jgi:hypothetical protein
VTWVRYCLRVCTHLGQNPTVTRISGLNTIQGWVVNPGLSSSLPFCVLFNVAVTRHAATLNTEPLAKSYSGGCPQTISRTHVHWFVPVLQSTLPS